MSTLPQAFRICRTLTQDITVHATSREQALALAKDTYVQDWATLAEDYTDLEPEDRNPDPFYDPIRSVNLPDHIFYSEGFNCCADCGNDDAVFSVKETDTRARFVCRGCLYTFYVNENGTEMNDD